MKSIDQIRNFENVDKPFWYNITAAIVAVISTFLAGVFAVLYAFKAVEPDPMATFYANPYFVCAIIFQIVSIASIATYVFIPFGVYDHWLRRHKFYFSASLKLSFIFAFVIMFLTLGAIVLEIYGQGWAKEAASEIMSLDALAAALNIVALVVFAIPSIILNAAFYDHNTNQFKTLYKNKKSK